MITNHRRTAPQVHETAFIATTAVIAGKVTVAEKARGMHGTVAVVKRFFVPSHAVAVGDPVRRYGSADHEMLSGAIKAAGSGDGSSEAVSMTEFRRSGERE